jgi:beta-lactamase regulating signal transducer with metallopeptidase domain
MLEMTVRGTMLLAAAFLIVAALRRASAAARHLVWATALGGLLALAALPALVPTWTVAVPEVVMPGVDIPVAAAAYVPRTVVVAVPKAVAVKKVDVARGVDVGAVPEVNVVSPAADGWRMPALGLGWLWIVWAVGALLVLSRLVVGVWRLRVAVRATEVIDDPAWTPMVRRVAAELGVGRPIALYRGAAGVVPVTSGIVRPIIIVPAESEGWDAERRRLVLTHEIAHVRRLDVLTHMVGQVAVALFWFHPLAWMAAARMRMERERACDDLVLAAGVRPSRYAGDLLEMAQTLGGENVPVAAALAMARRTEIEGRLMAILDGAVRRGPLGARRIVAAMAVAAVAIVALSVVRPVTASPVASGGEWSPGHGGGGRPTGEEMKLADAALAAGRMPSDAVKRQVLLDVALHHSASDTVRRALFSAVATMRSDDERRTVLLGSLGRGTRDAATVAAVARATEGMTSDVEKSAVLRTVAGVDRLSDADVQTAFFAATKTIASEGDRGAVLRAVMGEVRGRGDRLDASDGLARLAIASVATIHSTAIKGRLLREVVRSGWMTNAQVLRQFNICLIPKSAAS